MICSSWESWREELLAMALVVMGMIFAVKLYTYPLESIGGIGAVVIAGKRLASLFCCRRLCGEILRGGVDEVLVVAIVEKVT